MSVFHSAVGSALALAELRSLLVKFKYVRVLFASSAVASGSVPEETRLFRHKFNYIKVVFVSSALPSDEHIELFLNTTEFYFQVKYLESLRKEGKAVQCLMGSLSSL